MKKPPEHEVTVLLTRVGAADESAPGKLLELVYDDLRHLAAAYMQDERADHTLRATALVHEGGLVTTVKREWTMAKAWLFRDLTT